MPDFWDRAMLSFVILGMIGLLVYAGIEIGQGQAERRACLALGDGARWMREVPGMGDPECVRTTPVGPATPARR